MDTLRKFKDLSDNVVLIASMANEVKTVPIYVGEEQTGEKKYYPVYVKYYHRQTGRELLNIEGFEDEINFMLEDGVMDWINTVNTYEEWKYPLTLWSY
jgi:hypothetical protein